MHAHCICEFDIRGAVLGIEPGTYVTEIYQNDWAAIGGEDELFDRREVKLSQ
jgi:hypothetical protein